MLDIVRVLHLANVSVDDYEILVTIFYAYRGTSTLFLMSYLVMLLLYSIPESYEQYKLLTANTYAVLQSFTKQHNVY